VSCPNCDGGWVNDSCKGLVICPWCAGTDDGSMVHRIDMAVDLSFNNLVSMRRIEARERRLVDASQVS
jgi:hypothetical protein